METNAKPHEPSNGSYPQNLLDAVAAASAGDDDAVWEYAIPADLLGTIAYILHTFLLEREAGILRLRFQRKETLEEIAGVYDISRERVRVVEENALKRLCSPESLKYLRYGINQATQMDIDSAVEKVRLSELASAVAYLKEFCEVNSQEERPLVITPKTNVDDLLFNGLSARCCNCLRRAGINKIGDLEKITFKQFRQIRNLGVGTQNELINTLAEHCISFQEETDPNERIVLQITSVSNG